MVVLWITWLVTTVPPPGTANVLALLCSLGTMFLLARAAVRVGAGSGRRSPWWLAVVTMIGAASNATFVTWSSSGLETAMFGMFAVGWTLAACALHRNPTARALVVLTTWAALAQLTRPDGALLGIATVVLAAHARLSGRCSWRAVFVGLLPFVAPLAHLAWRHSYYGEWLPNTYYAKVVAAWPESGLRYLFCFVIEHGLWLWLLLVALWVVVGALRGASLRRLLGAGFPAFVAVCTWFVYVAYYTAVVGGDHFGWRPFAHLVPLLFLSVQWLGTSIAWRDRTTLLTLLAFAAVGNSVGWWQEIKLQGREQDGFVRMATRLPAPLGPWLGGYDRCRAWLRLHFVALPRGLHARSCERLLELLPERRNGWVQGLSPGQRGVYRTVAAGVVGWSLADVDVIDAVGLNDWFVARHRAAPPPAPFDAAGLRPTFTAFDADGDGRLGGMEIIQLAPLANFDGTGVLASPAGWAELLLALCDGDGDGLSIDEFEVAIRELQDQRHMAHERTPPPGYIEAMRINVVFGDDRFAVLPEIAPLSDAEVVQIEARFRRLVVGR